MHETDYTELVRPGKLIHFVYAKPTPAGTEITERVARVREMEPDGLGFVGECLRRTYEGSKPGRCFRFDRMHGAREWDGEPITNFSGLVVVPAASRVIAAIRERNPGLADRLQRQVDQVSAARQQDRDAETARETREAATEAGQDWAEIERERRREARRATRAGEINAMRDRQAEADARIREDRATKIATGTVAAGAWGGE